MGLGRIMMGMSDCFQNIFHGAVDLLNGIQESQVTPVNNAPTHPKLVHSKPKTSEFRGQCSLLPLTIRQFLRDESLERSPKLAPMGLQNRREMTPRNSPRVIRQFRKAQTLLHEMEGDMFVGECLNGGKGLLEVADFRPIPFIVQ